MGYMDLGTVTEQTDECHTLKTDVKSSTIQSFGSDEDKKLAMELMKKSLEKKKDPLGFFKGMYNRLSLITLLTYQTILA